MRHFPVILAAWTLAVSIPVAAEELTIVSTVTAMGQAKTSTTYMGSAKYAQSDGERGTILEYATGRIVTIDLKKKEYWETSVAEMSVMAQQTSDRMKQLSEQMKPQAAQMMEKMMGGALGQVTVQKGTGSKKIAGYDCEPYTIAMGDAMKIEMWTTTALHPPAQMFDARRAMVGPANPMTLEKMLAEMKKIGGYPLAETTTFSVTGARTGLEKSTEERNMVTATEATEVKKGPIPSSAFDVPAGFRRVESPYKFAAGAK